MGSPANDTDEPLTPAGRLFLQPEINQVIHCVMGLKNQIDIDAIKSGLCNSPILKHPRFTSLMVRDSRGFEHWRRTDIDIESHFVIIDDPVSSAASDESVINEYLAGLSIDPSSLSTDKPLWEIHLLMAQRRVDDGDDLPMMVSAIRSMSNGRTRTCWRNLWGFLLMLWFSFIYVLEFTLRSLWLRDRKTPITGGAGVELWPRKLATARFCLQDMKVVKAVLAHATINDILYGIISAGLSRYLDIREPNGLQDGLQITGLAMVNLREQKELQDLSHLMRGNSGARWGNKFGVLLLPVYYQRSNCTDPLEYVKRAKTVMDRKKQSFEALFSYKLGDLVMSYFGSKVASLLNYRTICNTSFTLSNVVGPKEEIMFYGNPVTFLRASSSSLPHALTMHMLSYAGRADMQILVAKDIIPDPEFLAKCFEDALLEMKAQAMAGM
ncbi:hypothetical protein L6164_032029 [Bauhinia variegata]|uniref:Uncharacterized protein n=1 Tax=Bauhinia variegata TaxID=167791 RepID=A0ACB9KMS9_BAUVA|nr:hypothetical protein L6164_032029 [Bauhinia variegata]